jgi:DnaK suppressor protein
MDKEFFRQKLLERKEELEEILREIKKDLSGVSRCEVKDEGDEMSLFMEKYRSEQLYRQQSAELREVEEALRRLEKGTYGICEMCESPIGEERLKVKPYAKYCIICKEIIEREGR